MTRPQFHKTPWTPAEEERLRAMIMSGMSVKDISTEHQRSVGAVRSRSEQLGISLKQVTVKRRRLVELGLKAKGGAAGK
jgi:hypothetical protein